MLSQGSLECTYDKKTEPQRTKTVLNEKFFEWKARDVRRLYKNPSKKRG